MPSRSDSDLLWGIDLGGTKIEAVALKGSEVLARHRIPTEAKGGIHHIVGRISTLLIEVETLVGAQAPKVGIGTPGTRDPETGLMRGCNTVALNDEPLLALLENRLGRPVKIANDANCFALAEARMGAGQGFSTVFGVIMGTGVGGGIVVNGQVLQGNQGIAGEWGHNQLEPDGPSCYCGRRGCVEVCISGPALEKRYSEISGRHFPLQKIALRATDGSDDHASQTLDYLYQSFGRAIATVINILDPEVIVLGGGVGNIKGLEIEGAKCALPHIFSPNPRINLAKPQLGDSAGVFGAALLYSS